MVLPEIGPPSRIQLGRLTCVRYRVPVAFNDVIRFVAKSRVYNLDKFGNDPLSLAKTLAGRRISNLLHRPAMILV